MVLNYTGTVTSHMLVTDMQKHLAWFTNVIRVSFFYAGQTVEVDLKPPSALLDYLKTNSDFQGVIRPETLTRLESLHQNLATIAEECIQRSRSSQPITLDLYEKFNQSMDDYAQQLRQVDDEISSVGVSIDPVTGLRTLSGIHDDLKREMDLRDRKNTPFCVCNLSLDPASYNENAFERQILEQLYTQMAEAMSGMLRSFDDAYHVGQGEFILCLKHVDILDSCGVMERLLEKIAKLQIPADAGQVLQATASCGVVEPIPGNEIDVILQHAKETRLDAQKEGGNMVFEYSEKSALVQAASHSVDQFSET